MYRTMNQPICQFYKIFFHISKCLACKDITAEDNKKRMIIANFINIYIYIYIYMLILYVTRMTQIKLIQ